MPATYSSRLRHSAFAPLLLRKRSSLASLDRLGASSMTPSLMFLPNVSQNLVYAVAASLRSPPSSPAPSAFSSPSFSASSAFPPSALPSAFSASAIAFFWSVASLRIISSTLRTSFLPITLRILCCCSCSRDTFSGRSSLSTTPRMKFR